jgi:protein-S-isoprenylcysteine O-methyltransferase Ste14
VQTLNELLGQPSWRFSISGCLITLYLLADLLARRGDPARVTPRAPRWIHPLVFASLTGFYLLIRPTGGPIAAGYGNLLGVALAVTACALRLSHGVRHPRLAGRGLLYVALPLAVGAPWGWLVLSLPAYAATVYCCVRAERATDLYRAAARLPRYRMVPGIW